MRRLLLSLAVILLPTAAFADTAWVAQMEEDEGGPVMVASVEAAPVGDLTPRLRLMCGGDGEVGLRYEMATDAGPEGSEADFVFENEHDKATLHMALEEMDGAYAAYFSETDPVIALLKTGEEVIVSESTGNFPAQTFTLTGSTKAIGKLLKSCN